MRLQLYEVNTSRQMGPGSPKLNTSLLRDNVSCLLAYPKQVMSNSSLKVKTLGSTPSFQPEEWSVRLPTGNWQWGTTDLTIELSLSSRPRSTVLASLGMGQPALVQQYDYLMHCERTSPIKLTHLAPHIFTFWVGEGVFSLSKCQWSDSVLSTGVEFNYFRYFMKVKSCNFCPSVIGLFHLAQWSHLTSGPVSKRIEMGSQKRYSALPFLWQH